ncbi:MAG: hypothetical protein J2P46_07785 [Zavarzinella sp.]|nr:hypothetical protein [Zavarzinella sp.]
MICVDDPRHCYALPPTGQLLTMVFAMAGKDRATMLRFDYQPEPAAIEMWYAVDGQLYQLVPPPAEIWSELVRTLWKDTRPAPDWRPPWWRRFRRRAPFPESPTAGTLPVRFGGVAIDFDILFFRGRSGEHIWVTKTTPLDLIHPADWFWHQCRAEKGDDQILVEFPNLDPKSNPPAGLDPPAAGPEATP